MEMSREKQIEEIANAIYDDPNAYDTYWRSHCEQLAETLYNAGYRKQSEGEWETIPDYQPNKLIACRHICSVCKTFYKDIRPHGHKYCPNCGAKMKGGAE
jgi:rubrerythrin